MQAMCPRKYQLLLKEFVSKGFRFPSKATITRARARIDLAASLIHREAFRHGRYSRPEHGVRTLYVYTDSSPSEGRDVMETIFDVCTRGSQPTMLLLPRVLLANGYSSANDKAAALLWQLWLDCGPLLQDLISCLCDIRCIAALCDPVQTSNITLSFKNIARVCDELSNMICLWK